MVDGKERMSSSTELCEKYFYELRKEYKRGQFTELTFRPALKIFIEGLNSNLSLSGENKKIPKIGKPDFVAFNKKNLKIGYVETKNLGLISSEKGLKDILESEQIGRYMHDAIPNLMLTDYLRFIFIRNKEVRLDICLINKEDFEKEKIINEDTLKKLKQLLDCLALFLDYSLPTIKTATELAHELSKRAKFLRELVKVQLQEDLEKAENKEETSPIYEFYEAFKELIKDAKPEDCVDAYAQTITYGLFLSKIGSHDGLNRDSAATYIPSSIKIIKKIFTNIAGDELPSDCSWIVEEIIDLLNAADLKKIIDEFVFEGKHYKDPFIHFYADFLEEYDPKTRKHLGVYYTPEPVVSFITTAINDILKKEFGKHLGFAEDSVYVLDFATGTGTFLANSFVLALKEIRKADQTGNERSKVKNHLLKHFYGFEILVSPYVIAHLKLLTLLKKEGYEIAGNERVQVYLTNTLDLSETRATLTGFFKELSIETMIANEIKKDAPILAIMGNPPYSVSSSNKSEWIMNLMKDYKKDLNEKNIKQLDDDYIKFIRFAQYKIEQINKGIIGIITNNEYLSGRTHRAIRKYIYDYFDEIYILNLHGDALKQELTGVKDENIFDIKKGVTISIFVKKETKQGNTNVHYYELIGKRTEKNSFLSENNLNKLNWKDINVKKPYYLFVPSSEKSLRKFSSFIPVNGIFKEFVVGVQTHRDELVVANTKEELKSRLKIIFNKSKTDEEVKSILNIKDTGSWSFKKARNKIIGNGLDETKIKEFSYRVFDKNYIYYDDALIDRSRRKLMKNFEHQNISLITDKLVARLPFFHAFISSKITDSCFISLRTKEGAYVFPLYTFNETNDNPTSQLTLNSKQIKSKSEKQANFTEDFLKFISERYPDKELSPEEILGYIYAVLHSPAYRQKYQESLKMDFPRIPFVKDYTKFVKLSKLGSELIELHLMKKQFSKNIAKFEISGSNEVRFVRYKDKKLYINDKQCFDNVPENIWNFHIGGYQVLDKWLKSRKGRQLSHPEVEIYIQIINILSETLKIMGEIDKIKID